MDSILNLPVFENGTFKGMPKHLVESGIGINGYVLQQQDWSVMLKILESIGRAKRVGKVANATVWELVLEGQLNFERFNSGANNVE